MVTNATITSPSLLLRLTSRNKQMYSMQRKIYTLVRVQKDADIYVSRSFKHLDGEAEDVIRGCICEDNDDGETTPEQIESHYVPDIFRILREYDKNRKEDFEDLEHEGILVWADKPYGDGHPAFTEYRIVPSICSDGDIPLMPFKEWSKTDKPAYLVGTEGSDWIFPSLSSAKKYIFTMFIEGNKWVEIYKVTLTPERKMQFEDYDAVVEEGFLLLGSKNFNRMECQRIFAGTTDKETADIEKIPLYSVDDIVEALYSLRG